MASRMGPAGKPAATVSLTHLQWLELQQFFWGGGEVVTSEYFHRRAWQLLSCRLKGFAKDAGHLVG
jgi:hypothetical protein